MQHLLANLCCYTKPERVRERLGYAKNQKRFLTETCGG